EVPHNNVVLTLSHFLEKVISTQSKTSFLIGDFKNVNNEKFYEAMKNFFINSLFLTDTLRNDNYDKILDILKDFVLTIRLLIKINYFPCQFFLQRLLDIHRYWKIDFVDENNIVENIENDRVSNIIFE